MKKDRNAAQKSRPKPGSGKKTDKVGKILAILVTKKRENKNYQQEEEKRKHHSQV